MPSKCNDIVVRFVQHILYLALLVFIFSACDSKVRTSYEMDYDRLFFKMKFHSIKRNEVNWMDLKKKVKDSIKVFASRKDFDRAVKLTVKLLDDHHSKFYESKSKNPFLAKKKALPGVVTKIINNSIGYIRIAGLGANDSLSRLYTINIRNALMALDEQGELAGWIIDLRGNNGGRSFIFPLGLSPLLQDSVFVYSKNNRGIKNINICTDNVYCEGKYKIIWIPECKRFVNKDKPIAVLMDSITASGGELSVVLLKAKKSTRTFGSRTDGATTTLTGFNIIFKKEHYHAQLLLATENWYDKDNNLIEGKLVPDVECIPQNSLDSAIRWIEKDSQLLTSAKLAIPKSINKVN